MLAKLVDGAIDPARMDVAVDAVAEELIPAFLDLDGAVLGYWAADTVTGRVLTMTMWRDVPALRGAAASDGAARATVGERIGLRLNSIQTLPVLACSPTTDLTGDPKEPGCIRVTWVDGVTPALRELVPEHYGSALADQSVTPGFRGSCWLGDEQSVEGCGVSLWEGHGDLAAGAHASRRRRRRLSRTMGIRVTSVHEYRILGIARATSKARPALQVAGV